LGKPSGSTVAATPVQNIMKTKEGVAQVLDVVGFLRVPSSIPVEVMTSPRKQVSLFWIKIDSLQQKLADTDSGAMYRRFC
jgi:hypothetical protein